MTQTSPRPDRAARPRTYQLAGQSLNAPALAGGLYLVATPIGNLGDITLRALETLAGADLIACEDTRTTRRLLERFAIEAPMLAYHDHNAASARPKLLARLAAGQAIALVSDAGTPLISDPGYKLAREAIAAALPVTALPGASALLSALCVAGLPTDRFFFDGFLPPKAGARQTRIAELAKVDATLVLFEGGSRIDEAMADLAAGLGDRPAAICRELTKLHETVERAGLGAFAARADADWERRGEFVIVIAPPTEAAISDADIEALLRAALERLSLKDAVAEIVALSQRPKREIYQRALDLAGDRAGEDDEGRS